MHVEKFVHRNAAVKKTLLAIICVIALINPSVAIGAQRLSLSDCIQMALDDHPKIDQAREDINIAHARKKQARSGYMPRLDLSAWYVHLNKDPVFVVPPGGLREQLTKKDIYNFTAFLKQPLFTGGLIKYSNKQAQAGIGVSESGMKATQRDIVFEVKQRYYDAQLAHELHRLAQSTLAKLNTTLGITRELFKEGLGEVTKIDYLKLKMLVESVRSQAVRFEKDSQLALEGLKNSIGMASPERIELADPRLRLKSHGLSADQITNEAQENYPELEMMEQGLAARRAGIKIAQSNYYPKIAAIGMVSHTEDHFGDLGIFNNTNQPMLAIGAALSMPLFDGLLTHHRIQEAKAELAKTRAQKKQLDQGLEAMLAKARSDVDKGRQQAAITRAVP